VTESCGVRSLKADKLIINFSQEDLFAAASVYC